MRILIMLFIIAALQTPYATSLSDLIKSDNEVECFSNYYDTKPEIVKENLDSFRLKYLTEIRNAGYNPKDFKHYIHIQVNFDKNGNIIPKTASNRDLMLIIKQG
jgi:hypothetical protein